MAFEAKMIKDSICNGHRLTTMQLTHPRIVHAEFNTHCMFARNASSSRAIPFSKMVQKVIDDPFIPIRFGKNQKGMQAFSYLEGMAHDKAVAYWLKARDRVIKIARFMACDDEVCDNCKGNGEVTFYAGAIEGDITETCKKCDGVGSGLGIHKQLVNRLLEPWMWITVCVTGDWTAWSNYFALRCHKDAEDNIQKQAYMAQKVYFENKPDDVTPGTWHLPYLDTEEAMQLPNEEAAVMVSVGRCARTSYLTQEGKRDFGEDVKLHDRLTTHTPLHASPLEHVCQAKGDDVRYHKYIGWKAYRHMLPNEYVTDFQPNYMEDHI